MAIPILWISLRPEARSRLSVLSPNMSENSLRASIIPKPMATTFLTAAQICTPRTSREENSNRLPPESSSRKRIALVPLRQALMRAVILPRATSSAWLGPEM